MDDDEATAASPRYEAGMAKVAAIFTEARDKLLEAKPIAQELEDELDDETEITDAKGVAEMVDGVTSDLDEMIAVLKGEADDDEEDGEADGD
jgi:hypothetical protein